MTDIFTKYPDLLSEEFVESFDFYNAFMPNNLEEASSEFEVAVALLHFNGNLTKVSKVLKRSRRSLEGFVSRNPLLLELLEDITATKIDAIEEGQFANALSGDPQSQRFFLETLGKERGYSKRAEHTGKGGSPIRTEDVGSKELARRLAFLLAQGSQEGTGEEEKS